MNTKLQRGLSLVELMIAMALSLLLMLGVTQVFLASKNSYVTNGALAELQENARFAMDAMAFDLRNLGFKGACLSSFDNASGSDSQIYSLGISGEPGKSAIEGVKASTGGPAWLPTGTISGTDAVLLKFSVDEGLQAKTIVGASINLKDGLKAKPGKPYVLSDQDRCQLLINDSDDSAKISSLTGALADLNDDALFAYEYKAIVYSIKTGADGSSALFTTDVSQVPNASSELVSGVSRMSIQYGVEGDVSGHISTYKIAKEMTDEDWGKVISLRVSLLLQSSLKNVSPEPMRVDFDGESITVPDRRLGMVVTNTIAARNYLP